MTQTNSPSNFEPFFLSDITTIQQYWPFVSLLIEECLEVSEYENTVEEVHARLLSGQALCFVVKQDTPEGVDIRLAVVFEVQAERKSLIIRAIAGENLLSFAGQFWNYFIGWAYMSGIRTFEGLVSPAVYRLVSRLGFEKPKSHIHVKFDLPGITEDGKT